MLKKTISILFPAMRISLALSLLTICVFLGAEIFGFTPQESKFLADSRIKISESLALQLSILIPDQDLAQIRRLVRYLVKRNPDIISAGIRLASGELVFDSDGHVEFWGDYQGKTSTTTHILVPMLQQQKLWGNVELRFESFKNETFLGFFDTAIFKLIVYIFVIGFFVYLAFMLRTLRQLDPSAVIPGRVNAAFDTLGEGVMILDEKEYILLANKSISDKIGISAESLLGMKISELGWKSISSKKYGKDYPWEKVIKTGKSTVGSQLIYKISKSNTIKFAINASPISSDKEGLQGVLLTLDDISQLEQHNTNLKKVVNRLQKTQSHVRQQNIELTYLATRDSLTGCLNRRSFSEQFEVLFKQAKEEQTELSCIMADLDHFKSVNDNFGHAVGDEVIILLAEILKSNTRTEDLVGRYGGEEFCVVLPGIPDEVAVKTAERIRLRIKSESALKFVNGPRVTASLGVASIFDKPDSPGDLNNLADEALYVAKETGRNKVVRWSGDKRQNLESDETTTAGDKVEVETENIDDLKTRIIELEEIASNVSAELEYNQSYDILTGLPNQVLFYDRVHQAIERGYREDQLAAVLAIDIDMFSHINNTLGRAVGDQVLRIFSDRLNKIFRSSDGVTRLTVSRFSADEFAVLLPDINEKDQVTWAVKRLIDSTNESILVEGNTIHITTNVGISFYPADASSVEELLSQSMTAKKFCKQHTATINYQFFDQEMQKISIKHLRMDKELHKAIKNNQWKLLYQPKMDLVNGKIVGAEALIRWQHPVRGLLSPYDFLSFAEQRKLIIPIGDWIINEACTQLRRWIDLGIDDCTVAMNLSSVQLIQPDIVMKIINGLEKYNIPPRLFEIEITESKLIDNMKIATESLKRLHTRGITVAIDDFGTGYSSLNYLKNLPINSLKIDRSFIKDICTDKGDEQIVKTLISMAKSLELTVVAEGVEDKEQLELLNKFDCDEIQGYLLSKPIESENLVDIIKNPQHYIQLPSTLSQVSTKAS